MLPPLNKVLSRQFFGICQQFFWKINKKEKSVHYVLHGLVRIFVVSVRITFVYVRAYHPFVSVSIRHSERSEEFFSVLLCANLCNLWCPSP